MALVNMSNQFSGLPMRDLIGGPLKAASDAQVQLANATANFIQVVGFNEDGSVRTAKFSFDRPVMAADSVSPPSQSTPQYQQEKVELVVPLLAIVNIPALNIKTVDITFDMEVKSSESSKSGSKYSAEMKAHGEANYGFFKASVDISGSVSSTNENTRSSDNSAKYHVEVHARDDGMPEGLSRVMDIMQSAIAPKSIGERKQITSP